MLSFFAQMIRWTFVLAIAATMTLSAFFLSLRYEGGGRFQISLKPKPGLEGTVIVHGSGPTSRPLRVASVPRPSKPAPPPSRSRAAAPRVVPGGPACAATRTALNRALKAYAQKTGRTMTTLDIFALLDAEVLAELPNCPRSGTYLRGPGGDVRCTLH